MPTFRVLTGSSKKELISLGRTGAMKKVMQALTDITQGNGPKRNWGKFKEAFESFGFTVVYDRNLAILITALFAAMAHDEAMRGLAAHVIHKEVTDDKDQKITLGQALLNGDGKRVYEILNCQNFKTILKNMGISDKCITKFLNRIKKITPWRLSGSKKVAETVKEILEKMTQKEYYIPVGDEETDIKGITSATEDSINSKLTASENSVQNIQKNIAKVMILKNNKDISEDTTQKVTKLEEEMTTMKTEAEKLLAQAKKHKESLAKITYGAPDIVESELGELKKQVESAAQQIQEIENKTTTKASEAEQLLLKTPSFLKDKLESVKSELESARTLSAALLGSFPTTQTIVKDIESGLGGNQLPDDANPLLQKIFGNVLNKAKQLAEQASSKANALLESVPKISAGAPDELINKVPDLEKEAQDTHTQAETAKQLATNHVEVLKVKFGVLLRINEISPDDRQTILKQAEQLTSKLGLLKLSKIDSSMNAIKEKIDKLIHDKVPKTISK